MKEVFEKIVERLEEERHPEIFGGWETMRIDRAKEIVHEVAEEYGPDTNVGSNGWIPCSERLPEECIEVLVSVQEIDGSTYTRTSWMQDGIWVIKKTPLHPTVNAWMPLPESYNGE